MGKASRETYAFVLQDVAVAFETSDGVRSVLGSIDLEVKRGEWLAVVGRNGSGKSTLGRVLAGLCPLSRGEALAADAGVIQMVFQNPEAQIVGETVYEDVCFGLENRAVPMEEMPARAEAAVRQVGLEAYLHRSVTELSGGQKQLLGIAGCLAVDAETIIFDEVTAMLDPESRAHVLAVVRELHQAGKTIVWITQWMEELAYADRVLALEAGASVYDGCPRAFFYEGACERMGFALPYAVQVAQALRMQGVELMSQPVAADEFEQSIREVIDVWESKLSV